MWVFLNKQLNLKQELQRLWSSRRQEVGIYFGGPIVVGNGALKLQLQGLFCARPLLHDTIS